MPKKISKYDLLKLIQQIWRKDDVIIKPFDDYFCDKSMIGSINGAFVYRLPENYSLMLKEMKNFCDEEMISR